MPETTLITHFYLKLGGADASEELMHDLVNVEVDDSLHIPDMFTLQVRDSNMKWVDSAQFAIGQEVEILASATGAASRSGSSSARSRPPNPIILTGKRQS